VTHPHYDYIWHHALNASTPLDTGELSVLGSQGWRVVSVVSRPGMPERALLERERVLPLKKGTSK
jgi:hypothetical protein